MRAKRPYRREIVRGTPIHIQGHTLIPVAQVVSLVRHRATIHDREIEGRGSGFVHVQPLHVIEVHEGRNRVLPVRDVTAQVIGQMALAAAIISLVSLVLVVANHRAKTHR
jgi:uncharacterized spore protein YtfJ